MADTLEEQLTKYLADAHSIEEQALAQLETAPEIAGDPELERAFREHLGETERHEEVVRGLLEARGARPSRVKETVMKIGGKGFVLFARSQPDTPGKLVAHAYSYEALELAAYELLRRVAERAGDTETAEAARAIGAEEQRMGDRLAERFDEAADAALRDVAPIDLGEQVTKYLADAHAVEGQALELLGKAEAIAGDSALASLYTRHRAETEEHQRLVRERLDALGAEPSLVKDLAMRAGALNWGAFFQAQPDTPGKLAAFAFAFEHLEIGGYEQLRHVAERAGDGETAALVLGILENERATAVRIAERFDEAVGSSLAAQGVSAGC